MERMAEYYYVTRTPRPRRSWTSGSPGRSPTPRSAPTGAFTIPSTLNWTGQPDTWNAGAAPAANTGLHVTVVDSSQDVGVAAAYARTLTYYAAEAGNTAAKTPRPRGCSTRLATHSDAKGIAVAETAQGLQPLRRHRSTSRPAGPARCPTATPSTSGSTFLSIRSFYKNDPDWPKVQAYLDGGAAPTFTYHRFWAQADIALAFAALLRTVPRRRHGQPLRHRVGLGVRQCLGKRQHPKRVQRHRDLQGRQQLEQRIRRDSYRHQHRQHRADGLEGQLDLGREPADHRFVERHGRPVGHHGHRDQRRLQRGTGSRRVDHVRFPGNLQRHQQRTDAHRVR